MFLSQWTKAPSPAGQPAADRASPQFRIEKSAAPAAEPPGISAALREPQLR
jgi:hypothetical protein